MEVTIKKPLEDIQKAACRQIQVCAKPEKYKMGRSGTEFIGFWYGLSVK